MNVDRETVTELSVSKSPLDVEFGDFAGWLGVSNEYMGERRWGVTYRLIARSPDGQYWAAEYTVPTGDGESYLDEHIEFVPVNAVQRMVTVYE